MNTKPRTSLSTLQRKNFRRILLLFIVASILVVIFAPNKGLLALKDRQQQVALLNQHIAALQQENTAITTEIKNLQTNQAYLEQIARGKHGMLKQNEMVFYFIDKKKKHK
jgi:cell division protein FtsB